MDTFWYLFVINYYLYDKLKFYLSKTCLEMYN